MNFHLVKNRKENSHHGHIPFNLKGNGDLFFLSMFVFFSSQMRRNHTTQDPIFISAKVTFW